MMNILLVEDQDDSRKTLSRLIGMRGHKVTQVATAEEAERAMATETFALPMSTRRQSLRSDARAKSFWEVSCGRSFPNFAVPLLKRIIGGLWPSRYQSNLKRATRAERSGSKCTPIPAAEASPLSFVTSPSVSAQKMTGSLKAKSNHWGRWPAESPTI